jgi:hypothetical protein
VLGSVAHILPCNDSIYKRLDGCTEVFRDSTERV